MNNEFESNTYKNLELFRYYLSKDLMRIDSKIQNSNSELLGFFLASLIDMSIVLLFDEFLKSWSLIYRFVTVVLLVVVFLFVAKIVSKVVNYYYRTRREIGKEEYLVNSAKQAIIDSFDNIACDGLLICENYISKYRTAGPQHVKNFCLYEVIHHLSKSVDIFNEIYCHLDLYVSSDDSELIDSYRINNYIDYACAVNRFLQEEIKKPEDEELKRDLDNLNEMISNWKYIK